jgi:hypothetical protein
MAIDPTNELAHFQQFVADRLKEGTTLSPEEAVDLWRLQNPEADEEFPNNVAGIREALADMQAGDHGVPFEEFDREFRKRHGLP